jgi:glyoxylase-like metal-dependent hydrolase (beta-lactamase superfamily II)
VARVITVAKDVRGVEMPLGNRVNTVYVVGDADQAVVFDVGVDGAGTDIAAALRTVGITAASVSHVIVSHCDVDHFGGLVSARTAFPRARILAHALDAPLIEDYQRYEDDRARGFRAYGVDEDPEVLAWARDVTRTAALDETVTGGEEIWLAGGTRVEIVHLPGHSHGHLGLWVEGSGTVVVSDAALGSAVPNADGSPAFPPTYRYVRDYRASVRRLRSMGAQHLATAHYGVFSGDTAETFLDESLSFTDTLEQLIGERLAAEGPQTLAGLTRALTVTAGGWPDEGTAGAMAFPVAGHLEDLAESGRVIKSEGHPPRWSLP